MFHKIKAMTVRYKNVIGNVCYSSSEWMVVPVLAFIATPVMIGQFGVELYGVWLIIRCITNFSEIANLGLGDATIKYVSHFLSLKKLRYVHYVVQMTLSIYFILGGMMSLTIIAVAPFLLTHLFHVPKESLSDCIWALRICGVSVFFLFLQQMLSSAFYGFERFDIAAKINMGATTVLYLSYILISFVSCRLAWLALATLVVQFVVCIILFVEVRNKLLPDLKLMFFFRLKVFRRIYRFSFFGWLNTIISVISSNIDRLVLAALLSPTDLTYYSVGKQLLSYANGVIAQGSRIIFPMAGKSMAMKEMHRMKQVYMRGTGVLCIAACFLMVPIMFASRYILSIWLSPEIASHATIVMQILCIRGIFQPIGSINYYYLLGSGMIHVQTLFLLITGMLNIVGVFVLTPIYGLQGTAVAQLISLPVMFISRYVIEKKLFHTTTPKIQIFCYFPILISLLAVTVFSYIAPFSPVSMVGLLVHLMMLSLISVTVSLPVAYHFLLK